MFVLKVNQFEVQKTLEEEGKEVAAMTTVTTQFVFTFFLEWSSCA